VVAYTRTTPPPKTSSCFCMLTTPGIQCSVSVQALCTALAAHMHTTGRIHTTGCVRSVERTRVHPRCVTILPVLTRQLPYGSHAAMHGSHRASHMHSPLHMLQHICQDGRCIKARSRLTHPNPLPGCVANQAVTAAARAVVRGCSDMLCTIEQQRKMK
jgi:hypothetical protein